MQTYSVMATYPVSGAKQDDMLQHEPVLYAVVCLSDLT